MMILDGGLLFGHLVITCI